MILNSSTTINTFEETETVLEEDTNGVLNNPMKVFYTNMLVKF